MYAFSSKSESEPFRALGDLTWNDPPVCEQGICEQGICEQGICSLITITSFNSDNLESKQILFER